jgi:hypothetical protein
MKKALLLSLALGLATLSGPARAGQGQAKAGPSKAPAQPAQQDSAKQAYVGVGVESLPPVLSSHLRNTLPNGQGVLVEEVAANSPAAKAGLQANDILTSYDDQKLYSPEQLIKLVHDTAPGHEATIGYVREGKTANCKVKLEERPASPMPEEQPNVQRRRVPERFRELFEQFRTRNDNSSLELIDAVKLTRLDNQRWRAEIDYRTKDGKKEHKSFEGTRDDIRKDIQSAKEIPANERQQLLHSLNLDQPMFEQGFPFLPMGASRPQYWDDR